jgi:hypothetical protein
MEALTDDRANPAGPQNKGVFHGHILLINNYLSLRRSPSSRKGHLITTVGVRGSYGKGGEAARTPRFCPAVAEHADAWIRF